MLVREWMTTVLVTVRPNAPMAEAQHLMRHRRIRHLPVVEGGRLAGIITDRDVRTVLPSPATSLAAGEIRYILDWLLVERVMTRSVITIGPDTPIADAVGLVLAHRIGALPVMENDRLVGIITETDLLRAFATMFAIEAPKLATVPPKLRPCRAPRCERPDIPSSCRSMARPAASPCCRLSASWPWRGGPGAAAARGLSAQSSRDR
jgi:CBS domain-containing protein